MISPYPTTAGLRTNESVAAMRRSGILLPSPAWPNYLMMARAQHLESISDECYDEITFDDTFVSAAAIDPTA